MTLFAIQHIASGELMPVAARGRGYSHWNPSNPKATFSARGDAPRLFARLESAKRAVSAWVAFPNAFTDSRTSYYGEVDVYVDSKDDGRKKEDLRVVAVTLDIVMG